MRKSRKAEILRFLIGHPEGCTWSDLTFSFPEKTLDRHLKAFIEEELVEKTLEPRIKGRKGRQPTRYRAKAIEVMLHPVKMNGADWVFGKLIKGGFGRRDHVRVFDKKNNKYKLYSLSRLVRPMSVKQKEEYWKQKQMSKPKDDSRLTVGDLYGKTKKEMKR